MSLAQLLATPEGENGAALVAPGAFADVSIEDIRHGVQAIVSSQNMQALEILAGACATGGRTLIAAAYVSIHTIYRIFENAKKGKVPGGYRSFTDWVDSYADVHFPFSRSSVFEKMHDIDGWRSVGAEWETIQDLLANTPMAGRDALKLLIEPAQAKTTITEAGEIVESGDVFVGDQPAGEYLDSLTTMGPGPARRDVREKAGIPHRWVREALYIPAQKRLLVHAVWDDEHDVDIAIPDIDQDTARWLCQMLKVTMGVQT